MCVCPLQASVPVDVMPGQYDPTNYTLPQQPLHRCMFPLSVPFPTLQLVSNPFQAVVDGVQWVTAFIFILCWWQVLLTVTVLWSQVLGHSRTERQWYCEVQQCGRSSGDIRKHTETPSPGSHRPGHTGSGHTIFFVLFIYLHLFGSDCWLFMGYSGLFLS